MTLQAGVAENGVSTAVYQYDINGNHIGGYNKAGGILSITMRKTT